jgi:hypothetical protein
MFHKTQTHCSPNLIFAGVLNNSYMYTIYFFKKIKKQHFEKYKVKGQIWRLWIHTCAEYISATGHWKGHFISFEISIKWALYLNLGRSYATFSETICAEETRFFFTTLDVSFQKSSGHKAVKFGSNAYLNWDYSLTKNHSILRGSIWKCLFSVLIWCGMTLQPILLLHLSNKKLPCDL